MEILNAKITSTLFGYEDHGILTCYLHFDISGGSSIAFGGYNLNSIGTGYFVKKILDVVGVNEWELLVGKHVRIKLEDRRLVAIGNIMDDRWFDPKTDKGWLDLFPKEE